MSAMRDMSRAIRHELQEHGQTLRDIPDDALSEYGQTLHAFYLDVRAEKDRREREADLLAVEETHGP